MSALLLAVVGCLLGGPGARAESLPQLTLGSASETTLTGVTLSGSVSSSSELQGCWFEWGVPPRFEAGAPCDLGPPNGAVRYASARVAGLMPGTTYEWRLAGSNAAGVTHSETGYFPTSGTPAEEPQLEVLPPAPEAPLAPAPATARGHLEDGNYVAYCPDGASPARTGAGPRARSAMADHTGWPALQCLKMDKGSYGGSHTLTGLAGVHNYLLGGYGNDAIWGGEDGDVIWGDYQPSGQSTSEHDAIHGGPGSDWIYSSHGHDEIWTGAGDDHVALVYGWGTVHCDGPGLKTLVMRYLPRNRHWRLVGCSHIHITPYRA